MSENIEKKVFSSSIFGKKEEAPKPKGDEPPEEDELSPPEQTDEETKIEEERLTKETWETHPEELKEITKIAQDADFKEVSIKTGTMWQTRFRNPDILFFSRNSLDNFRTALKFIGKEDIYQGMRVEFLALKKRFEGSKLEIYRKFHIEDNKLEKLREGEETDEKKLLEKAICLVIGQKNIDKLDRELDEYPGSKLSESEIKEQALRFNITNILYAGIENSRVVKIVRLKESKDKKKISPVDYQKQFLEIVSPLLQHIQELFPNLNKETIKKFGGEALKTAEQIGEKYLKQKQEEEKYDFGIYR